MNKYARLLVYELKTIIREKMTLILLIYPLFMLLIGAFLIPGLIDNYGETAAGQEMASLIVIIIFAAIAPFVGSSLLGFSLLDHKDENTLDTIRVTPLSLKGYVLFKTAYVYVLTANAAFWTLFGVKHLSGDAYTFHGVNLWDFFSAGDIAVFALVAAAFTPVFAFFLAAISKNKIEGFAYMKVFGVVAIMPAIIALEPLQDFRQYFLGIWPLFWPTKGLLVDVGLLEHAHNLHAFWYMAIGIVYPLALSLLLFGFFERNLD